MTGSPWPTWPTGWPSTTSASSRTTMRSHCCGPCWRWRPCRRRNSPMTRPTAIRGTPGSGGSLPVDREQLATRLGFSGVIPHARDAMWQADGFVDLLATLATAATEAGQVAADLEIWASPAYGFVTLADEYCRVSALMPQKKNPYALAVIRHAGGAATGALAGLLAGLRTPTARTDHFLTAVGDVDRALTTVTGAVRLLAGVLTTLTVDRAALARTAADPGLVLADLADRIVGEGL